MGSNLMKRVVTAVVLIAVLALSLYASHEYPQGWLALAGFFSLAVIIAALEFSKICQHNGTLFLKIAYFIVIIIPAWRVALWGLIGNRGIAEAFSQISLAVFISLMLAVVLMVMSGYRALECASDLTKDIFIGIVLLGVGGASLLTLTFAGNSFALLWLICVVCLNDIAAYFVGSRVGGPLMSPYISPKKTISGSIGGFVFGILAGVSARHLLPDAEILQLIVLSVMIVASAQLGDLSKSYVKRIHGVKDSGHILPGHGGVLDRIDGLLLSAPVLCLWLMFLN